MCCFYLPLPDKCKINFKVNGTQQMNNLNSPAYESQWINLGFD